MGIPGPFELIVILIALVIPAALCWRVFSKAGFPGALGLLVLIPGLGFFIVLIVLAFAEWPIEQELREARQGRHD